MDREIDVGAGARLIVRGVADDGSVANVDVELIDLHGARWSATVLTVGEIQRLMRLYRSTGECRGGAYFRVADLLILDEPSLTALVSVIEELVRTGTHRFELAPLEEL
jgi:hypothetical protein